MKRLLPATLILLLPASWPGDAPPLRSGRAADVRASAVAPSSPPATYGAWRSSKIGGGGYVQNVVFAPSDPKRMYAYVDVGGVYRSDDGGRRWRMMNLSLPHLATRTLLVDPRDANRILAAIGDQWDGGTHGLFESRDGGETWKNVAPGVQFYGNESYRAAGVVLARDPKNPDVVVAASGGTGVWRSENGGTTWKKQQGGEGLFPSDLKWSRDGSALLLCSQAVKVWGKDQPYTPGLFTSADGGRTWRKKADSAPTEMSQDPKDAARWVGLFGGDGGAPVRVTTDGGATWADYAQGLPAPGDKGNVSDTRYDALGVGPDFYALGSRRGTFWRRGPGDAAWTRVERESVTEVYEGEPWYGKITPGKWQHFGAATGSVVIDPRDPARWLFTDWYAIYESRDAGKNWALSMDGVEVTVLHTLTQDPSDPAVVHLGMADNGYLRSEDGGERFAAPKVMSNAKSIALSPKLPARVYAAGDAGNGQWRANTVWVSDDRGKTWARSPMAGLPDPEKHNINSIAVAPDDPQTVYAAVSQAVGKGKGGVYRSRDGAKTWEWFGEGLPEGQSLFHHEVWGYFREVAVDPAGNVIVASTDRNAIYLRPKGAAAWTKAEWAPQNGGKCRTLIADPKTPGRFVLGAGKAGVWATDDAGKTWRRLLDVPAESVAIDAANPNRLAAGTVGGPRVSEDGGKTWRVLDARLPHPEGVLVAFAGERLIVGTGGEGAFWAPLAPKGEKPVAARR